MATGHDIHITDLSGHTFTIELHWDIVFMKCQSCAHYEEVYIKMISVMKRGITRYDFMTQYNEYRYEWYNSDHIKKLDNMY